MPVPLPFPALVPMIFPLINLLIGYLLFLLLGCDPPYTPPDDTVGTDEYYNPT